MAFLGFCSGLLPWVWVIVFLSFQQLPRSVKICQTNLGIAGIYEESWTGTPPQSASLRNLQVGDVLGRTMTGPLAKRIGPWQWHCQICNLLSWTSLGGCASQLASGLRCIYNWDQLGVHMDIPDLTELYWIIIYLLYGYISSYVAQVLVSKFLVPWRTPK